MGLTKRMFEITELIERLSLSVRRRTKKAEWYQLYEVHIDGVPN